jgi:hypothetical protein
MKLKMALLGGASRDGRWKRTRRGTDVRPVQQPEPTGRMWSLLLPPTQPPSNRR